MERAAAASTFGIWTRTSLWGIAGSLPFALAPLDFAFPRSGDGDGDGEEELVSNGFFFLAFEDFFEVLDFSLWSDSSSEEEEVLFFLEWDPDLEVDLLLGVGFLLGFPFL